MIFFSQSLSISAITAVASNDRCINLTLSLYQFFSVSILLSHDIFFSQSLSLSNSVTVVAIYDKMFNPYSLSINFSNSLYQKHQWFISFPVDYYISVYQSFSVSLSISLSLYVFLSRYQFFSLSLSDIYCFLINLTNVLTMLYLKGHKSPPYTWFRNTTNGKELFFLQQKEFKTLFRISKFSHLHDSDSTGWAHGQWCGSALMVCGSKKIINVDPNPDPGQ